MRAYTFSERIFASSVLITLGVGFLLAYVYLYTTEIEPHHRKGQDLLKGVEDAYHGDPSTNRLESVLHDKMAENVSREEMATIHAWIQGGATQEGFAAVKPIVTGNCASCHDATGDPPLITNYAQLHALVRYDSGVAIQSLARMTHVHLLAIPLLFFMLSSFFVRTRYREGFKALLIALPFFGALFDIANWWLTKRYGSAALGIIVGGTIMGLGFAGQWLLTAIELWLPRSWVSRLRWLLPAQSPQS